MEHSIPPRLHKYQPVAGSPHTEHNLRKGQLRFSHPQELNDPFDCSIPFRIWGTDADFLRLFKVQLDDLKNTGRSHDISKHKSLYLTNGRPNSRYKKAVYEALRKKDQERFLEFFSEMRVACSTERLDSILMWSHYADGHRGLCLEFDTSCFPFHDQKGLHRVIYSNSYPALSPYDMIGSPTKLANPLITKANSWKYEREWRLIRGDDGDSLLEHDPKALTGIYFGCSMSDDNKRLIAAIPAKSNARLFCMKRSGTKFQSEIVPYPC